VYEKRCTLWPESTGSNTRVPGDRRGCLVTKTVHSNIAVVRSFFVRECFIRSLLEVLSQQATLNENILQEITTLVIRGGELLGGPSGHLESLTHNAKS
jgi:hypothetical protein